jgi:hypothetical protein
MKKRNALVMWTILVIMCASCKKSDDVQNVIDPTTTTTVKNPPIIQNFIADSNRLQPTETTEIHWNVEKATKVILSRNGKTDEPGMGQIASSGTMQIDPTQFGDADNAYRLEATNNDGMVYKEIQITVLFPNVEYRVSGSTCCVFITYVNNTGETSEAYANTPWTYSFSGAHSGQFLSVSAQNQMGLGSVKVQIYKNNKLFRESETSGGYGIASASGDY